MELSGEVLIGAPRDTVWRALNDPAVLVRCIPGGEDVRRIADNEMHARVVLRVGPVRARFVGKVVMSEIRPGQGCVLNFEGSGGAAGFASGRSAITLDDAGAGTRLRYDAAASVGGKLGQVGGRLIDAAAKKMADQFFAALAEALGSAPASSGAAGTVGTAESVASAASITAATAGAALPVATSASATAESVRVLWFCLGAASTGFGVALAALFLR